MKLNVNTDKSKWMVVRKDQGPNICKVKMNGEVMKEAQKYLGVTINVDGIGSKKLTHSLYRSGRKYEERWKRCRRGPWHKKNFRSEELAH